MLEQVLEVLASYGPEVLVTALILVGAAREWWVWGVVYRRERAEKEYWREKCLSNLGLAEKSVELMADNIINPATKGQG